MELDRRSCLATLGLGALGTVAPTGAQADPPSCPPASGSLLLSDFRPRSMLHVKETRVATPRFPVIDVHTHFTFAKDGRKGAAPEDAVSFMMAPKDAVAVLDRSGVRSVVNLTGGFGQGLEQTIAAFDRDVPGPLPHVHGADVGRVGEPALPAAPGRRDREGGPGRGGGPEGPEDPRPLPPRERPGGAARQGGRPALRPDVGGVRRAPACPSTSTSRTPRPSSSPSTARTSGGTSSGTTPTGPSTGATSRATRS